MSGLVEIIDPGLFASIQDQGRFGHRNIGAPVSGALDAPMMTAANALAGNGRDCAALEIRVAGPTLRVVDGVVRCALAGGAEALVTRVDASTRKIPAQVGVVLHAGDILKVGRASALAYLALSGGFDVAPMLGSRSTYVRAGLGGVRGRDLAKGDLIACGMASGDLQKDFRQALVFGHAPGPLRVIAGPQDDHFDRDQQALFFGADYRVSPQMDRMGVRFEGPRLKHNARGAEILTDGVTPGAIQVPPDGAPIALSVDGQTTGGYPKIGVIISADLPRLGALRPGDVVRFAQVKLEEAAAARRERAQALEAWMSGIVEAYAPGALNEAMLYGGNLVSGVARGDEINEADLWERWRDAH